ncbi:GntR family transcriptional regulator [Cupriavidus pauculus]|jgi:DNA-binding GntR family transcriptional regulator|uniref:GntR family transcriptional regulator n=1 Tax=Cupriavidus pauculus TaxID=82633 RepID=A0A5P2H2Z9_9BURK|nr:GntR family transcriptional regulator [Cupriavidus pauculus]QET02352.1 GntR family transcriptional regulator [Cupriavidus pauculus]
MSKNLKLIAAATDDLPAADLKPARKGSVEERMYHEIYDAIMEHRLPPRTKLTEQSLCEIYATARHTVRKVLSRLAADGMVDLEPNRGAFIASPSTDEAHDMFELRQMLERAVLDKLAARADVKSVIAPLRRMVATERQAFLSHERPRWIRLSAEFHTALAELSGNALLVTMMRRLVSRTTLMIASVEAPGHNACSFDEHDDILDALEAGDAALAQARMAHHLGACADRVQPDEPGNFDLRSVLGQGGGHTR